MSTTPTHTTGNRTAKTPSRTPTRRAFSAEPTSARRPVHTPLDRTAPRDLLNSVRRGTSASGGRRNNAPTPHAKAARRALNDRRTAAFTPGKNRRRSIREQRETPMGLLRNLGRALAPSSRPVVSSSSPGDKSSIAPIQEEDEEDELSFSRPEFTLPIDEDDDDELVPPRLSGLEEENYTVRSVELPRRAISEQPGRLSRGSFGTVRESDFFNNDPTEDLGRQSDFFPGLLEDLQARAGDAADFTYERVDVDPTRRSTVGRESDFGLVMPEGLEDQTTFFLSEPGAEAGATSPLENRSFTEAMAQQERQSLGDVALPSDDDDNEPLPAMDDELSIAGDEEIDLTEAIAPERKRGPKPRRKTKRISKHGIEYPALPPAFVKKVAQTSLQSSGLSSSKISADTLTALTQASEWFFEQLGDDLGAYANHAKRKTIEESDVVTLMRRQRQVGSTSTMFSLAQRHLPRELLQELRMPAPHPVKQRRGAKKSRTVDNDETMEIT